MKLKGLVFILVLLLGLCACQTALALDVSTFDELDANISTTNCTVTTSFALEGDLVIPSGKTVTVDAGVTIDGANKAYTVTTSGPNAFILKGGTLDGVKIVSTNNTSTSQYIVQLRDDSTVKNCEFSGEYNSATSTGVGTIAMKVDGSGFLIDNNVISNLRQPANIHDIVNPYTRVFTGIVSNNTVKNTRGFAISINSDVTFTNNDLTDNNHLGIAIYLLSQHPDNGNRFYKNLYTLSANNHGAYIQNQYSKVTAFGGEYVISDNFHVGHSTETTKYANDLGAAIADATSGPITLTFQSVYTETGNVTIPQDATLNVGAFDVDLGDCTLAQNKKANVMLGTGSLSDSNNLSSTPISGSGSVTIIGDASNRPIIYVPPSPRKPTASPVPPAPTASPAPPAPPALTVNSSSLSLVVGGDTATLTASEAGVSWSTSDATVAIVNGGTVRGIAKGSATITAKAADGRTANCDVTVELPGQEPEDEGDGEGEDGDESGSGTGTDTGSGSGVATQIDLGIEKLAMPKGKTFTLPRMTDVQGFWSVENPAIARLSGDGQRLTALANGTTNLIFSCTGTADSKAVTVGDRPLYEGAQYRIEVDVRKKAELPTKIMLSKSKKTLKVGNSYQLNPKVKPAAALDTEVFFVSSKKSVAVVNKHGLITALKPGKAKIRVYTANLKYKTITITVKK